MEINRSFQPEFKSPDFAPKQISDLRCRLGQCRADFARSLGVALETIYAWENGSELPTPRIRSLMVRLDQNADEYSDKTALRPAIECALRERKLGQIHGTELMLELDLKPDVTLES